MSMIRLLNRNIGIHYMCNNTNTVNTIKENNFVLLLGFALTSFLTVYKL